jgi:hypothetical protein
LKESLSFPYLGSIINIDDDNSISEEITHRIKKGNTTYYVCKGLLTSKLINIYTEKKIYMTIIRWAVTYTYKTWTLYGTYIIHNLLVFKRQY